MVGQFLSLFAAIVGVAALTVAVSHSQTASIITSFGNAFSGALKAAEGG
jgi:hypothetical protein